MVTDSGIVSRQVKPKSGAKAFGRLIRERNYSLFEMSEAHPIESEKSTNTQERRAKEMKKKNRSL